MSPSRSACRKRSWKCGMSWRPTPRSMQPSSPASSIGWTYRRARWEHSSITRRVAPTSRRSAESLVFKLAEGSSSVTTTVSMAFQFALAGILLGAELVKRARRSRLDHDPHAHQPAASIDRSPRPPPAPAIARVAVSDADADFGDAYRRKYEAVEAA